MPGDVMVNFYINLSKLCLTVYQLHVLPPNTTKVRPCDPAVDVIAAHPAAVSLLSLLSSLELQANRKLCVAQSRSDVVSLISRYGPFGLSWSLFLFIEQ